MPLSTAKMTDLPFPFRFPSLHSPLPSRFRPHHPFKVLFSTSTAPPNPNTNPNPNRRYPWDPDASPRPPPSPPWHHRATSPSVVVDRNPPAGNHTSIERIVLRLRNLGLDGSDPKASPSSDPPETSDGELKLGDLLQKSWKRPDQLEVDDEDEEVEKGLPWEREEEVVDLDGEVEGEGGRWRRRKVKAPTLAELTLEDVELRRLRRMGIRIKERLTVPQAGVTQAMVERIKKIWRKKELVRLKFHEKLAHDMKLAHELVERRTGGLVIWRAGSVMVVYRGSSYESSTKTPPADGDKASEEVSPEGVEFFVPDVSKVANTLAESSNSTSVLAQGTKLSAYSSQPDSEMTEEEVEFNHLLDGLGPRFVDWWGTGIIPVDGDLLPQNIPGFKTPYRLLPTGMRSRLTNAELTGLRKMSRNLPCHFALGRNRHHHGLAAAILKLWEKSLVVKIAVKRGVQNTNNKLMAEELKKLTGGALLMRNKYYIVIYRGKDFLPPSVTAALAERQELAESVQDVEEKARVSINESLHENGGSECPVQKQELAEDNQDFEEKAQDDQSEHPHAKKGVEHSAVGTLAEFLEAQARWGRKITAEEREEMKKEASRKTVARLVKRIEHKLSLAEAKKLRAEKLLAKIEASMVPVGPSDDQETITEEERAVFRRIGLRMKAYLPLGIRGVFDGVIENMHLHWKHRELVKLISKQKTLAFVEDTARLLEYESGGILVAIERVPKGYALIYYRGKNYQRPISIRPRNLLTKAKALKRSIAMQRHEALSQHICELEKTTSQYRSQLGNPEDLAADENNDSYFESPETDDEESDSEYSDDESDADGEEADNEDFECQYGDDDNNSDGDESFLSDDGDDFEDELK